jgi:serine phosphatase RsbU (regulator of sigma subunit)
MSRIVVVEDNPGMLRGLADNLRNQDYEVLTAANGIEGYRLVRENQPDLVILDLMLPGMDGFEICRQMRHSGLVTPVVMLTARDQETARIQGFDAGADDYVTKPFSIGELMGRVRAILRRSEGRSDVASQHELDEARRIQERLLPSKIPQIRGLQIAGTSRPARIVGGDYFDVLKFNAHTVGVCIADVCGKGMPASLLMANLQATVKAYASERIPPHKLCEKVNRALCENMASGRFVTLFYAVVDAKKKLFTYCNAGHNPPLVFSPGNSPQRLSRGGAVLGIFDHWQYEEEEIRLNSGDRVLMYTDGVTESRNAEGEEFGESQILDLVCRLPGGDAAMLADEVVEAATRFSHGSFEDDLTVVALSIS